MATRVVSFGDQPFGENGLWAWLVEGKRLALPSVTIEMATRIGRSPIFSGVTREEDRVPVIIILDGDALDDQRAELLEALDPEDETSEKLTITDSNHGPRFKYAVCESCVPFKEGGRVLARVYLASFVVDGDTRWRSRDLVVENTWTVANTGETTTISNEGDADAYPVIDIKPTLAKTSAAYDKERWFPIFWQVDESAVNYPVDITDGGLDLSADAQADGDDIVVYVDGVVVDRWLGGALVADVKVWVNLDFAAPASVLLKTALDNVTEYTEVEAASDISSFPVADGIFMIESEAFTYTQRNSAQNKFEGVQRAAKGTSKAAHTTTKYIKWVQHDIWLRYGDATATAPTVDDDYKPIFNLTTSTNTSWVYAEFGETGKPRAGAFWEFMDNPSAGGVTEKYTGNHDADAEPWTELGLQGLPPAGGGWSDALWLYQHPCKITEVNFTNGESRFTNSVAAGSPPNLILRFIVSYGNFPINGYSEELVYLPLDTVPAAVTETGDDQGGGGASQLSGWTTLIWPSATDLYVNIVDDGGGDFHVDLYDHDDKIVEVGDLDTQLSNWDTVLGLTSGNTDSGKVYVQIVDDDGGTNFHVDLYGEGEIPGEAGVKVVGTDQLGGFSNITGLSTLNTNNWYIYPVIIDEGAGDFRVEIYRESRGIEEAGDNNNQLSGWANVTGISAANTDNRIIYAFVVDESGGNFHVNLYSHPDGVLQSGAALNFVSRLYKVTGVTETNSDGGKLYIVKEDDGGGFYHVDIYKDSGLASANLVAHTATYNGSGEKALTADNSSGIGGRLWCETAGTPSGAKIADYSHLVATTDTYAAGGTETLYAKFGSGIGGTITIDAAAANDTDIEVYFSQKIAHTGTFTGKESATLYQDEGSGVGGSISILTNAPAADDSIQVYAPLHKRIAHTASYNGVGSKALTPDNGSGVHGAVTVDAVTAADIYIEVDYSNRVGHTAPYSAAGAVMVVGDFDSGMGGSITIDEATAADSNIEVEFDYWQDWSFTGLSNPDDIHALYFKSAVHVEAFDETTDNAQVEVADATITLDSSETPDITIGSATGPYALDATITNQATDEAITLETGIETNETLAVDTEAKTVVYEKDNSNRRGALSKDSVRKDWLRLQPGDNTLRFDETGLDNVEVDISYRKRTRD